MEAKEMCMNNPIVKGQYDKADNPIFEVFYLDDAKAVIADFSGNPPNIHFKNKQKPDSFVGLSVYG